MRKLFIGMAGSAAMAFACAANAAVTVDSTTLQSVTGPSTVDGITTIGYSDALLSTPSFTEALTFTNDLAGLYTISVTTSSENVDFDSLLTSLAGLGGPYSFIKVDDDGINEAWRLPSPVSLAAGQYTLNIGGTNDGAGSLGGSITIRPAVPEPATWAMMLLGFGAVGFAMRRRRKPALAQIA